MTQSAPHTPLTGTTGFTAAPNIRVNTISDAKYYLVIFPGPVGDPTVESERSMLTLMVLWGEPVTWSTYISPHTQALFKTNVKSGSAERMKDVGTSIGSFFLLLSNFHSNGGGDVNDYECVWGFFGFFATLKKDTCVIY